VRATARRAQIRTARRGSIPKDQVDGVIASALAREAKEAAMREAIQHGGTTAALLGLTETMRRLGLE